MAFAPERHGLAQEHPTETGDRPLLAPEVPPSEQFPQADFIDVPWQFIFPAAKPTFQQSTAAAGTEAGGAQLSAAEPFADDLKYLPRNVLRFPRRPLPTHRFAVLQKWEGTVLSIADNEEVVAVVRDLTDRSSPDEEATFSIEEFAPSDRSLMVPGAIFYWNIGYRTTDSGQRERVSVFRFRRLPGWTRSEIEAVRRKAQSLKELLGLDGESSATAGA